MASFKEASSKIYFIVSPCCPKSCCCNKLFHFTLLLKQKLISRLITFFRLSRGIFVGNVEKPQVAIGNNSFLMIRFLVASITGWLFCPGQCICLYSFLANVCVYIIFIFISDIYCLY